MDFEPRIYGKYFLLDKIATGGMAEVYKAKTFGLRGFERLLVIKQILPHLTKDKEFVDMFIDEAKISVELSHANIVQVYDLGKIGNNYFIAMEYIDGKDLRALIKKCHATDQPISLSHAAHIMIELLKGLDYAHKKKDPRTQKPLNIVHRDISPQNIMLSYEGEVKVVDFGIAKAEMRLNETQAGVLKGKFGYMSPEQATGHEMDARSDLFACGIILYELLTGRRLFLGDNDLETLELIRLAEIPSIRQYNPDVPEALEAIVLQALARETSARFQDARAMQLELTKFMFTYNQQFSGSDLANTMKSLFAQEMQDERQKLAHALAVLEERYRLNEPEEISQITKTQIDAVSFIHDNEESRQQTLKTPSAKITLAHIPTQYQSKPPIAAPSKPLIPWLLWQQHAHDWLAKLQTQLQRLPRRYLWLGLTGAALISSWYLLPLQPTPHKISPAPVTTGSMQIDSEPSGAQVWHQAKLLGNTPLRVELAANQDQLLQFRLDGYADKSMTVYFTPGENTNLQVNLEKAVAATSNLRVISTPAGAQIFLNGEDSGKRTPFTFEQLERGKNYTLRLHRRGYAPADATVNLEQPLHEQEFKLVARDGVITIETDPSGATVAINGNTIGTAPAQASVSMDRSYTITATLKNYQNYKREIRVNDDNEVVKILLKPARLDYGYLSINADPWAIVYLDGELLGHTPVIKHKVSLGQHQLDLQHPDYGSKKETIDVGKANDENAPLLIIRNFK